MLRNDLKQQLPEGWEDQFKHHESCPEDYYDVAEFEINGSKKILVFNRNTMDLMEYYYDDIPDDQWINLEKYFIHFMKIKNVINYYINKNLKIYNSSNKLERDFKSCSDLRRSYPVISFRYNNKTVAINVHRVIGFIFIPNPNPDINTVINHIDLDKFNFFKRKFRMGQ